MKKIYSLSCFVAWNHKCRTRNSEFRSSLRRSPMQASVPSLLHSLLNIRHWTFKQSAFQTRLIFVLIFCCLFMGSTLWGQDNLITNSDLEDALCGDSPGINCAHFHDCVPAWTISHGTPNYFATECNDEHEQSDHHIQLICKNPKTEGVFTSVDLEPGCHQLFIKVRVFEIDPEMDVRLRISLDHGLEPWDELVCQQPIPSTSNTTLIYDEPLDESGDWQWIVVDFGITEKNAFLNQLAITGLLTEVTTLHQAAVHIDCIYLYRNCEEVLKFVNNDNSAITIADGVYNSCSYILVESAPGGSVRVGPNAQVEMYAVDYIRLLPNFHTHHNFRAATAEACTNPDNGFRPACHECERKGGGNNPGGGGGGDGEIPPHEQFGNDELTFAGATWSVFPNPAVDQFTVKFSKEGFHEIKIYDLLGSLKYQGQHQASLNLEVSNWRKGLYLVEVADIQDGKRSTVKLMIQ